MEFLDNIKHHMYKLTSIGLEYILIPMALFFAPLKGILITVAAFIVLDTISGIWKSKVNKVPITSKGLSAAVSKMLLYQLSVITVFLLDYYVIGDILKGVFGIEGLAVKVTAMLLIFIEGQSINENYKVAKGVDLWKEFKKLLMRVKEVTTEVSSMNKDLSGVNSNKSKKENKDIEDLGEVFQD